MLRNALLHGTRNLYRGLVGTGRTSGRGRGPRSPAQPPLVWEVRWQKTLKLEAFWPSDVQKSWNCPPSIGILWSVICWALVVIVSTLQFNVCPHKTRKQSRLPLVYAVCNAVLYELYYSRLRCRIETSTANCSFLPSVAARRLLFSGHQPQGHSRNKELHEPSKFFLTTQWFVCLFICTISQYDRFHSSKCRGPRLYCTKSRRKYELPQETRPIYRGQVSLAHN